MCECLCMWCGEDQAPRLSVQLESNTDLVTAGVEVLAIDQRGQRQHDSLAQLLLVAQTDLAVVVDLGANRRVLVQIVGGAQAQLGSVRVVVPGQLRTKGQVGVHLVVERGAKVLSVVTVNA